MVTNLTIRSLNHFEFIFVYNVRIFSNIIVLHVTVLFYQENLLKRLFYPLVYSCQGLAGYRYMNLFLDSLFCLIYVSVFFVPGPSCFDYCISSVVWNQGLIWSALFFSFKIALANWGLLCFHKNVRIIYSSLVKNIFDILVGIALNL